MTARTGDILIDSSGWIQYLRRKGDPATAERVKQLIVIDRAVWCDLVQLELWRGISSEGDRKNLNELAGEIRSLEVSPAVWQTGFTIAAKCRPKGIAVPITDLIIFACAKVHRVEMFHRDKHFDLLAGIS